MFRFHDVKKAQNENLLNLHFYMTQSLKVMDFSQFIVVPASHFCLLQTGIVTW